MKKTTLRWLSFICVLALVLACAPVTALAEEAEDPFVVENGVLVAYNGDPSVSEIVIPADRGITEIGDEALGFPSVYWDCSIVVPEGVTRIGSRSFCNNNLLAVSLPSTLREIGASAFSSCHQLTNLELPQGLTTIGNSAFAYTKLSNIILPDSVSSLGDGLFIGCLSLTSVTLPAGLTAIPAELFRNCASLTDVTIPDSVTKIGEAAFAGCSSLTDLYLPDGITEIQPRAFFCCDAILHCSSETTAAAVTAYGRVPNSSDSNLPPEELFVVGDGVLTAYNGEAARVVIPADRGITEIGANAFESYGSGPFTVVVPEGVTRIGDGAFSLSSLTAISLPSTLREIGAIAFQSCPLESIELPQGLTTIGWCAFYLSSLSSIEIPDSVTTIGGGAFAYTSLKTIVIPDSVTELGSNLFEWCSSLTSVTLPSGLTEIPDRLFWNCINLPNVTIPDSVTRIGMEAFAGNSIRYLILPDGVAEFDIGAFNAFGGLLYCRDGSYAAAYIEEQGLKRGYYGDVTGDGALDSRDARLLLQFSVNAVELGETRQRIADITNDDKIDSKDARAILQAAVT